MNPFITIWTSPYDTIEHVKDSDWVKGSGLIPYFIFGINGVFGSKVFLLLDDEPSLQTKIIFSSILILVGIGFALIARFLWVHLLYFCGRLFKGQATKENIDSVLALSLIPEAFRFIYFVLAISIGGQDITNAKVSNAFEIICYLMSTGILFIGLYRVQKFGYKYSLLNILIPIVVVATIVFLIR